jgi:putative transposase
MSIMQPSGRASMDREPIRLGKCPACSDNADHQRRRLAVKGKTLGRRRLALVARIVTPDTVLRWYPTLAAMKYDGTNQLRPVRPRTKPDIAALVVRMADENPTLGLRAHPQGLKSLKWTWPITVPAGIPVHADAPAACSRPRTSNGSVAIIN